MSDYHEAEETYEVPESVEGFLIEAKGIVVCKGPWRNGLAPGYLTPPLPIPDEATLTFPFAIFFKVDAPTASEAQSIAADRFKELTTDIDFMVYGTEPVNVGDRVEDYNFVAGGDDWVEDWGGRKIQTGQWENLGHPGSAEDEEPLTDQCPSNIEIHGEIITEIIDGSTGVGYLIPVT